MTSKTRDPLSALEAKGFRGRIVSIERLPELRDEIDTCRRETGFDPGLERDYLSALAFSPPSGLPDARSLIVVAAPDPQIEVAFHRKGKSVWLRIPPTYVHDSDVRVERVVSEMLEPDGYRLARAVVPEKLLAVRSGLAEYGRNNIAYVSGMGSFHRLTAYFSDLPCTTDSWREKKSLDRCQTCRACREACPTGAIPADRFLIHAERCLTFILERRGEFPEWVDPSWHHCLIGCMRCQVACPENRHVKDWIERRGSFTEEETELILDGGAEDNRLPSETKKKLERLDIMEYKELLQRNLGAILNRG